MLIPPFIVVHCNHCLRGRLFLSDQILLTFSSVVLDTSGILIIRDISSESWNCRYRATLQYFFL